MSTGEFSGEPLTRWDGERDMTLVEALSYIDPKGRLWTAPEGAALNGATIPRALWSAIGAPYAGKYRRASVIHDYFVGELDNPDPSGPDRKKADRMFYDACRTDGCSKRFAALLYAGVRFGTWSAGLSGPFKMMDTGEEQEGLRERPEFEYTRNKFWTMMDEAGDAIDAADLDRIDEVMARHFAPNGPADE